jgi:8-hydroxy-5-deazaflavin:NADPH oxidoreductase
MKIGIFGTGDVGTTLANGFLATGHQVMMGSREAANEKALAWAKEAGAGSKASTGTFADAAKFADLAVLAVSWTGAENALKLAGAENLAGKVVIDAMNPLTFGPRGLELAIGHTDSAGEQVQRWLPEARVVKAFNSVGYAQMFKPEFSGGPPDMFICGNDDGAKKTVTDVLMSFGWSTIDVGRIEGARLLEPLCVLWIDYAMRAKSHSHAFKLLRK